MVYINKLSDQLHQRILGWEPQHIPKSVVKDAEAGYVRFGLDKAVDTNPIVNLPLPDFMGTWEQCVDEAVETYGRSYLDRLQSLVDAPTPDMPARRPPLRQGWQVWLNERWLTLEKPEPTSRCAVLDFETVNVDGFWYPACAVLLSAEGALYVWQANLNKTTEDGSQLALDRTVGTLPTGCLYAGWNTPYDRTYIAQEYLLEDSGNRFFDGMAAFIAVRGLSNQQRIAYNAMSEDDNPAAWVDETATNGLAAVYKHYTGQSIDKGIRDRMVAGGLPYMRHNFSDVIWYCIEDVLHTHVALKYVHRELSQSQPSAASWTGQLLLGSSWLPLSKERYPGYYDRCEGLYQEELKRINDNLVAVAVEVLLSGDRENVWLSQLDWTTAKQGSVLDKVPAVEPHLDRLSGYITVSKGGIKRLKVPEWFLDFVKAPSIRKRDVPLFLQVTYLGQPVIWKATRELDKRGKMCYGWWAGEDWLPHPEKRGKATTTLFPKGYGSLWEEGVLSSSMPGTSALVKSLVSTINWVSFRERAASIHTEAPEGYPVVLPQLTVTGTVTRRAADNVFQVMANPKKGRIGTEFKSLVEAIGDDWAIVGADVASQEAWICGLLGDSAKGYNGATPMGYMILVGTKEDKTEIHSLFAELLGMSRDAVKVVNYGVIYGMGEKGAINAMLKASPTEDPALVKVKAEKHIKLFKGERAQGSQQWIGGLASASFNKMERIATAKEPRTPVLNAAISKALSTTGKDYMTTKVNWTIQSSGVDFRDLLILLTRYFFDKLGVEGRFLITIHDEIRTMVKRSQAKLAAYALQLAHVCVRAAFIDRLSLDCIPMGIAWFPEIDVDTVVRKEVDMPCITPSQPTAIAPGYKLHPSDLVDISHSLAC